MDFLYSIAQNKTLFSLVLFILLLFAAVAIIKSLIKTAATIVLLGAAIYIIVFWVVPEYWPEKGKQVAENTAAYIEKTLIPVVEQELKHASFEKKEDGSFLVRSKSLIIEGKANEKTVTVTYKGKTIKTDIGKLGNSLEQFIEKNLTQNHQDKPH